MATIKSIEEKAKAYDEVLKKARMFYKDEHVDNEVNSLLEVLFPELKESENERIRKAIHIYFDWLDGRKDYAPKGKYTIRDMIAWLEKQDEPNPYSGVSFKYNGHTWGMCARDNGVEILVDREIKERVFLDSKPQGKSALEAINEEKVDNANKVEPRQEKLTEFERAVKQVMEEAIECGDTRNLKADADMLLSLVHKSSWSEEDEKFLSDIIKDLVHPWNEYIPDRIEDEIKWLKNKLKSLRPQSTWKPSGEQIKAVKEAACYSSVFSEKTIDNLISLSKQLKKLREE